MLLEPMKASRRVAQPNPDVIVTILLAAWWLLNLVQAACMDLANDEAYYWYFSQHLDWGYYDHPPLVAVLVWLTSWMGGTLGVRFGATLLQPLYLLLFWHLVRPDNPTRRDAWLYVLLCFSQPLLQLYGFLALPDAPLLMSTVLFLWAWRRFCRRGNVADALLLGLTVALLGYSKYHGALVVLLVVLSNPRMLRRWQLWLAAAVALLLYAPHLWWQYTHGWVSFSYHLVGRNADSYRAGFTLEYLALALVVFNPLWLWHCLKGFRQRQADDPFGRALRWLLAGFLLFFLVATLRGPVQPQWLLPAVFPCIALTFSACRQSRYALTAGWVCLALFLAVRVVAVANPFGFKGEMWHQREQYEAIAAVADGRPVVFMHTYTAPPKYTFYTGGEAYCAPYFFNRHSQWQYDTSDRALAGREVMVCNFTNRQPGVLPLDMGGGYRQLYYSYVPGYRPTRELSATLAAPLDVRLPLFPECRDSVAPLPLAFKVYNPYAYDIYSTDSVPIRVSLYFHYGQRQAKSAVCTLADTLRAGDTTLLRCTLRMPRGLPDGTYPMGFAIGRTDLRPSDTGPRYRVSVKNRNRHLTIQTIQQP